MVNACEVKFRQYLKKQYPNAFIKKLPDFKQTGITGGAGLPDYLVIDNGITDWYEVKKVSSATKFPFSALADVQWVVCRQLVNAGASVWIVAYMRNERVIFSFKRLLEARAFFSTATSVDVYALTS